MALWQDEEEGEYYIAKFRDYWTQNIYRIACAKLQNKNQVYLNDISGGLEGVFEFKNIGDIQVEIPENLASIDEKIDITSQKVSEKFDFNNNNERYFKIEYSSINGNYRVFFKVSPEQKDDFLNILNKPTPEFFAELANDIPKEENQDVYKLLSQLPECSYREIDTKDRIKYLEWLTGEINMNADQENIVINLLKYNDDKTGLFNELYNRPIVTAKIAKKTNGENKEIVLNELVKLCYNSWTDNTPKGVIYTGATKVTIGVDEHDADYITYASHLEGSNKWNVKNYPGIFSGGIFNIGQVQEYPPFVEYKSNILDPYCVYIDDKSYILPALYPAQLSEQLGNMAMFNQFVNSITQIALLYGGAKLISALTPEIRIMLDYLRVTPKSFAVLFGADLALQASTNYLVEGDWEEALNQVDYFDAAFTGVTGNLITLPLKGGQLLYLSKYGKQLKVCRKISETITRVVTIELTKITFDYTYADSELKMLCDYKEENFNLLSRLLLALVAKYSSDEIHKFLKGLNNKVAENIDDEFDNIAKSLLLKINDIIKTDNFQKVIESGSNALIKYIKTLKQKNVNLNYKIKEKKDIQKSIKEIKNNSSKIIEPKKN
jgi:hypothetical protein